MSAIELLGESIDKGHGRAFEADQLREIGETLQAMQYELMNQTGRTEALTRLATVAVDLLGGNIDMTAAVYEEAQGLGLDVSWDDKKDVIHAKTYKVEVPAVRDEDETDVGEGDSDLPSVSDERGAEGELASGEASEG
jgi:hypothetical protein